MSLLSSGCASIVTGSKQHVPIASVPIGATVTINGEVKGKTPMAIDLKRNEYHSISIDLAGYEPYRIETSRGVNPWTFGNLVLFTLPVLVDFSTGAFASIEPESVMAPLSKKSADMQSGPIAATPILVGDATEIHATSAGQPTELTKVGQTPQITRSESEDPATKLRRLKELKDAGILTEDEYETRRKALIEKL